ncbi:MAG TPA: type III toxin-antitoxin system ToxN/AbiQ family toxin [Bacilli bacterium]|nr:type III toxin-antitoxin system ToxN/AbiQ family toxin [Bacilli bacterium]
MIINFEIVKIDSEYCDYLRGFDARVTYNKNEKSLRPFLGALIEINNCKYFAPLSSPKPKHEKMKNIIDFIKIDGGKLGAINFNNMIPVKENNYVLVDLNTKLSSRDDIIYQNLLKEQLRWLNKNKSSILKASNKLYFSYVNNSLSINIRNRCCNFLLLEEKCNLYNINNNI